MHLTMIALTSGTMLDEHNNPGETLVRVVSRWRPSTNPSSS